MTTQAAIAPRARPAWWRGETLRTAGTAIAIALFGSLIIGGLTSFGQQYLPPWVNSLSNSAGGWSMFAFLLVWLGRSRMPLAALLGIVSFVALNEGYGLVSGWRGFDYGAPFTSQWTLVGLAAGPLVGVSASLARYGSPLWRALAVTPLCAVLLGEGIYGLIAVAATTSVVYWTIEIVLSAVFVTLAIRTTRIRLRLVAPVVAVWLLGSAVFLAIWLRSS